MRAPAAALALGAALAVAACHDVPPLDSCADSLDGVWSTAGGPAWHFLDSGARIDGYPIARELPAEPPGTLAAPALLSLRRGPGTVTGTVSRRWQRGDRTCVVRARAVIRGCAGDRATLELGPTGAPADWTSCAAAGAPVAQLLRRTWARPAP